MVDASNICWAKWGKRHLRKNGASNYIFRRRFNMCWGRRYMIRHYVYLEWSARYGHIRIWRRIRNCCDTCISLLLDEVQFTHTMHASKWLCARVFVSRATFVVGRRLRKCILVCMTKLTGQHERNSFTSFDTHFSLRPLHLLLPQRNSPFFVFSWFQQELNARYIILDWVAMTPFEWDDEMEWARLIESSRIDQSDQT